MNKQRYIWWIGHANNSIGSWKTEKEAREAIETGLKGGTLRDDVKWYAKKHEISMCPICGQSAEKDIINSLGCCLSCDHVQGDVDHGEYKSDN